MDDYKNWKYITHHHALSTKQYIFFSLHAKKGGRGIVCYLINILSDKFKLSFNSTTCINRQLYIIHYFSYIDDVIGSSLQKQQREV